MWQRFTERARRVILLGQEEAGKTNSGYVGTEHLLLGLVRENESVGAQVLQKMGVSFSDVRREIEGEVSPGGHGADAEPKLTSSAKRVLELAADEARRMRHNYIGTEHLLLALLREKSGLAATVLRRLGLDLEKARLQVLEYLGPDAAEISSPPGTAPKRETRFLSEPEEHISLTLTEFVDNLNAGLAFPDNQKFVFGARPGYFGANEWAANWNRERKQNRIQIQKIAVDKIEDNSAQASVSYRISGATPSKTPLIDTINEQGWTEIVALKRSEGEKIPWQIAAPEEFPLSANWSEPALLAQAAFALAQHESEAKPFDAAKRSQSQIKQLALAALQFSADWNDSFAFAPQYVREALQPYHRGAQLWTIPGTDATYAFNERLCDKKLDQIAAREQTVLFYEGEAEQLAFRYDGKAAVAFVDGHCALVSPGEAQQLIWAP